MQIKPLNVSFYDYKYHTFISCDPHDPNTLLEWLNNIKNKNARITNTKKNINYIYKDPCDGDSYDSALECFVDPNDKLLIDHKDYILIQHHPLHMNQYEQYELDNPILHLHCININLHFNKLTTAHVKHIYTFLASNIMLDQF